MHRTSALSVLLLPLLPALLSALMACAPALSAVESSPFVALTLNAQWPGHRTAGGLLVLPGSPP